MSDSILEIPALIQNKIVKRIVFSDEGLTIESKSYFGETVFIRKEDITSFRYGVKFLRGYKFIIGRQYLIEIKDIENSVFKIKLNTCYGIKRDIYVDLWSKIINNLWHNCFINIFNYHINLYNLNDEFEFAGIKFHKDGISWDDKNKLLWNEIALSNYRTYFMIHHIDNPKQHKGANFLNNWNAFILQCLLKEIVEQHK